MDPNENLRNQRELAALILKEYDKPHSDADRIAPLAEDLATHVQALDTWIAKGGALPTAWVRK